MKLKFKDYEASGSPKEMAEFLRLTQEKVECKLPEDFEERWVNDFKRRWDEMMKKAAEEPNSMDFNFVGVPPTAFPLRVGDGVSVIDRYMIKPNRFHKD
jgi:hypothetical protein